MKIVIKINDNFCIWVWIIKISEFYKNFEIVCQKTYKIEKMKKKPLNLNKLLKKTFQTRFERLVYLFI